MKSRLFRLAFAAAIGLFALAAQAVPVINWVGTDAGGASIGGIDQICKNGDLACTPAPRDNAFFSGWILAGGYLTVSEAATVTMSYWGKEAGFRNRFLWAGATVFTTSSAVGLEGLGAGGLGLAPLATGPDVAAAAGTLDFAFRINTASGAGGPSANLLVPNGTGNRREDQPNIGFFFGADPAAPANPNAVGTSGTTVWLLLDDGCGFVGKGLGGCDDDHDDMLVALSVAPIPEPGTLALLLAGVLAMGAVFSRRRGMGAPFA